MASAIEFSSVENVVIDSETVVRRDSTRNFEYKLDDKAAKGKLLKGVKREPFEVVENSASSNLLFNLGSWNNVVMPSIRYWNEGKGNKSCKIGDNIVNIANVKTGKDIGGKHIDTQVIFYSNRDKVVLHCYNTTQLILVNGHGYAKLIEIFLKPYFESKISMNLELIKQFNETALEALGNKRVKRSDVKYSGGPTHLWCTRCPKFYLQKLSIHIIGTSSTSFH